MAMNDTSCGIANATPPRATVVKIAAIAKVTL